MALFSIKNGEAKKIPLVEDELEKNIQKIFQDNLNEIRDITFIKSEHSIVLNGERKRIDTLGIDNNGSPVIIEYKRNQSNSIIPQVGAYMIWLLSHKADFNALVQEKTNIDVDKINWESPRAICVAKSYNQNDLNIANSKEIMAINIELYKFCIHQSKIDKSKFLLVEPATQRTVQQQQTHPSNEEKTEKPPERKICPYTLEHHLGKATPNIKKIFEVINEKIYALDVEIRREPKKVYIAYKYGTNFADIVVKRNALVISLNMPRSAKLDDPHNLSRVRSEQQKNADWGNGWHEINLKGENVDEEKIEQVLALIKQSYTYRK